MGRRSRKPKAPPRKSYDLITKETDEGLVIFNLIKQLTGQGAPKQELHKARIGAAWMVKIKPDKDGRVTLGKLKRCSELERQLHSLDAIVLLNQSYWRVLKPAQRLALLHHELCHLAPALDSDGHDQAVDGHGELRWRGVKHDLEEFSEVVRAHGCYKEDIRKFAEGLLKKDPNLDLFNENAAKPIGEATMAPLPAAAAPGGNGAEHSEAKRPLITGRGKKSTKGQVEITVS